MRIGELSARSGVPVPTIKFYLRERLLPSGRGDAPQQTQYDQEHLRQLRLIRALIDMGGLPVAAIRTILGMVAGPARDVPGTLDATRSALPRKSDGVDDQAQRRAEDTTTRLIHRLGWTIAENDPARGTITEAVATLYRLDQDLLVGLLDDYASAAESIAYQDIDAIRSAADPDTQAETVVAATVLGGVVLEALRRLAHTQAWSAPPDRDSRSPAPSGTDSPA